MFKWIHKFGSPPFVYRLCRAFGPWLGWLCVLTMLTGLYLGLVKAPPDYEQGDSYRISLVFLVWKMKLADVVARASAPIGASFTFVALITGSIWGKPMWGTWWVWDARLTSELLLLFLYLGYIALRNAFENPTVAGRAASVLALVGVVNIPIIHFSVEWWNTLHQPATISKFDKPSMHISMLVPLLIMVVSFQLLYAYNLMIRIRTGILEREKGARWIGELLESGRA